MNSCRHVTIKDIAERLGISHSTVSRALSDAPKAPVNSDTRKRIRETAKEMGYSPNLMARAVVTGKSDTLGLITYQIASSGTQIQGFIQEAHLQGYQILMGLATVRGSRDLLDDQKLQIQQVLARGVDGLLVHTQGFVEEGQRILEAVAGRVPVVAFSYPIEGISNVVLDRAAGFFAATEHLIGLGHCDIGYIGPHWDNRDLTRTKGEGYFRAVQAHGLRPRWISCDGVTMEDGYRLGLALGQASDRPSALLCRTDQTAIGVCRGLQEMGVEVPDEVALVGAGDQEFGAFFTPAITTQRTPTEKICQTAVALLMAQLDGETAERQVVVKPELLVRESCGARTGSDTAFYDVVESGDFRSKM